MTDNIEAATIGIATCEDDCTCQSVHLTMYYPDQEPMAHASFSPEMARRIAQDILKKADEAEAQDLKNRARLT